MKYIYTESFICISWNIRECQIFVWKRISLALKALYSENSETPVVQSKEIISANKHLFPIHQKLRTLRTLVMPIFSIRRICASCIGEKLNARPREKDFKTASVYSRGQIYF